MSERKTQRVMFSCGKCGEEIVEFVTDMGFDGPFRAPRFCPCCDPKGVQYHEEDHDVGSH